MSYWTPERLREFLAHRPSYREHCDGIDCGNFPQWQCFHCANAFCFDCALKHFGLPLESEHPECSRQPDPDTAALVAFARMCIASNTPPIRGEFAIEYGALAIRFLLQGDRSPELVAQMEELTTKMKGSP